MVKTSNATIGVRGTVILGETGPSGDSIGCSQGAITVQTPQGIMNVGANQKTIVKRGKAPSAPIPFTAKEKNKMEKGMGNKKNKKED